MQSSITSFLSFSKHICFDLKTPMFPKENTGVLKTRGSC